VKNLILFLTLILLTISCKPQSSALSAKYNKDNYEAQCSELKKDLTRSDYKILLAYIDQHQDEINQNLDKSYNHWLKVARKKEADEIEQMNKIGKDLQKTAKSMGGLKTINRINHADYSADESKLIKKAEGLLTEFSIRFFHGGYQSRKAMYSEKYRAGFNNYVAQAKTISRTEFDNLNLIDASNILKIKAEFTLAELNEMNNEEIYDYYIQNEVVVIKENPILENPTVHSENHITGYFSIGGNFKKQMQFEKEGSDWKINYWDTQEEKLRKEKELLEMVKKEKSEVWSAMAENLEFVE